MTSLWWDKIITKCLHATSWRIGSMSLMTLKFFKTSQRLVIHVSSVIYNYILRH